MQRIGRLPSVEDPRRRMFERATDTIRKSLGLAMRLATAQGAPALRADHFLAVILSNSASNAAHLIHLGGVPRGEPGWCLPHCVPGLSMHGDPSTGSASCECRCGARAACVVSCRRDRGTKRLGTEHLLIATFEAEIGLAKSIAGNTGVRCATIASVLQACAISPQLRAE